ncbi:hypothetical protein DEA8626_00194 [Defluviimonas aquaemixtae]|uniref:YdhG-like domain-containing protein n=1 Tax=Albidovulum aquaemixtae TaxID=1542388 RepID=A0A2R8B283_9RHOB|nr:DUF1801 domain-containing protein [Defluviimonas aquaemixtae]SPH16683.1 hypothetical protein DEA8626_00194 [Defluviimonas aquaemixtae]
MTKNPEVDAWLDRYDNPMKPVVAALRDRVLSALPEVSEAIKWQAPTFIYKGNIASFFPKAKAHTSLMFHTGSTIPGDFPNLEGEGKEARTFKVKDLADLDAKEAELLAIIRAWIAMKQADT